VAWPRVWRRLLRGRLFGLFGHHGGGFRAELGFGLDPRLGLGACVLRGVHGGRRGIGGAPDAPERGDHPSGYKPTGIFRDVSDVTFATKSFDPV